MTKIWSLHNALKGWTLFDLDQNEIQLLVHVMSDNEVKLSLICKKGDSHWQSLSETAFPEFFIKKQMNSSGYPDLCVEKGTFTGTEIDTGYFKIKQKIVLPRLHHRHDISVPCTVFANRKTFNTESVNLSGGGIQFKDVLPDWIAGYFIVGIVTPQGLLQLMCSVVEDQKDKRRVQIVSEETEPQYNEYKQWLQTLKPLS